MDTTSVSMQVDTGAAVSIIPASLYKKSLQMYSLRNTDIKLKSYTGDQIPIVGKLEVPVTYGEQHYMLPVVVAEGDSPALMGRDWLSKLKLNWSTIFSVTQGTPSDLHRLLKTNAELFENDGATIKGHAASLKLKSDHHPVYQKARPVPYAIQELVEAEIARLEKSGILYPVPCSDWASPTVNVVKIKQGKPKVRICGDYKKVNLTIDDDKYPLLNAQDLFANLANKGKSECVFTFRPEWGLQPIGGG
jgi:hypothetical protein